MIRIHNLPVMMTTFPATLGPLGATLVRAGSEPLPARWLPIAWTRRFAESDIVLVTLTTSCA